MDLLVPSDTPEATAVARSETANIRQYRPNTAFIMMWISDEHPDLEDVKNAIKEVFKNFGITAVRSDEPNTLIKLPSEFWRRLLHPSSLSPT
jgi:hypothetical protein